jgi:hypothetical protein
MAAFGSRRVGALAGITMALLWAPMAVVIPVLPDLGSASEIERFYGRHAETMKVILASVSVGFTAFLVFLGALVEELRQAKESGWIWSAMASALMFMTALGVALGLDAAAVLLYGQASAETVWALHSAAFLLAAPAAGAGVAFFVAAAVLAFGSDALPRHLGWLAVAGAAVNLGALGGFFSSTGPLNSGNGLIGGLAGPVLLWLVWIVAVSVDWLTRTSAQPGGRPRPRGGY